MSGLVGVTEHPERNAGSMKRYNGLWQQVCSRENIGLAYQRAKKGKSHYREVQLVEKNKEWHFNELQMMLTDKTFRNSPYREELRNDSGKERLIKILPFWPDRIAQHCVANVVEPLLNKSLVRDTYSSIKRRGVHDGVRRIKRAMEDRKGTAFCLKLDIKKYYDSINNDLLKIMVRRKIKDLDVLWMLDLVIDSAIGVPIGNYLSPIFGNLYLSPVDHYAKEVLKCRYYYRYCDDIVVLSSSKERLHLVRQEIEKAVNDLKLEIKSSWQIFPVDSRGVDFLGYRFFHGFTLVRKSIVQNFKKKMKRGKSESIPAYYGWFCHANSYRLRRKYACCV